MKKIIPSSLLFLSCFYLQGHSQNIFPLFDGVSYGFNTGYYPGGLSPSSVKAGDMDNDGDIDLVVSRENFSNGFVFLRNKGKGQYNPPVAYASPKASKDIVIADFNKDGRKDVALTNAGQNNEGNSVSVYLSKNNGLLAAVNYVVGKSPTGIVAADFDNDGDVDIAAANTYAATGSISILVNKGNGQFQPAVNFPAGETPYKIAAARINNDTLIDIVVGNMGSRMNVLFNGGNNNFSQRVQKTVFEFPYGGDSYANVEAADMDNDGDNDIVYSSTHTYNGSNGQIALFRNKGNGTFMPLKFIDLAINTGGAADIEVADLNKDGWKDIVAANYSARHGDGYQVVLNNKAGGFLPAMLHPAGQSTYALTTADVDKDNNIDIITADFYSLQVTVHKNPGNGVFPVPPIYNTNNVIPGSMDAADIDGDGDLDIVSSASSIAATGVTVTVQKNNGNGSFTDGVTYSIRGGGVQAKFLDLNGDDKPDLIFATAISSPPYDFHTAINKGNGTFGAIKTWGMNACGWSDIDAFDMDNDGDKDAVITEWLGCISEPNSAKRIFISKNNGNGNFAPPVTKIVAPHPSCLAGADFNQDGKMDLATGHSASIAVHLGTGNGNLQPPKTFAVQQSPYDMVIDDFNNDGHWDVAACTEFDFEGMSVLLGNGNGTFHPAKNYKGAYSPDLRNESGITSGDVDGDGDVDIMVGNTASNDLSVYFNNGSGSFSFKKRYGIYYDVAAPIFADFTGDGKKDIAALVGQPPIGVTGGLAIVKGKVPAFQNMAVTSAAADATAIKQARVNNSMLVLNNPFTNYLDIKFNGIAAGKLVLKLTDLAGRVIATQELAGALASVVRFNTGNKATESGMYVLTAETPGKKYSVNITKQ